MFRIPQSAGLPGRDVTAHRCPRLIASAISSSALAMPKGATALIWYDASNQVVRFQTPSATQEFYHNPAGQRVSTWNAGTGAQIAGNYYWGSTPVAFYYNDNKTHFQHQDWVGTEREQTSYNGAVEATYTSLPFGDQTAINGLNQDGDHFAGLDYDQTSYIHRAQFRDYSQLQGRWLSPDPYAGSYDPSNPQSFNRYAYALNNPVSLVDPSGLVPRLACYPRPTPAASVTITVRDPDGKPLSDSSSYLQANSYFFCYFYDDGISSSSGFFGLFSGSSAPSNGTPLYKNPCIQSALAKGAASTALDAVGLLPEGGAVAGAFSLWHGAAGVSNGIKILQRVKFGVGIISTANAGSDASQDGALSLAGAQLATGFASIGAGLAKATPIVGQVLSGISVAEDLYGTYKAVAGCHP